MFEGRSWSGNERNCCFLNTGGDRWADVSAVSGFDFPDDARAVAVTDWDHDGDLDLWVNNRNAPRLRFLRNDVGQKNHFLAVRLQGVTCNRDAIGARVTVELSGKKPRKLHRTLYAGDAYQSQSTKWLVFGLGDHRQIKRTVVQWPDGRVEAFDDLAADRRYRIVQGRGRAEMLPNQPRQLNLIASTPKLPPTTDAARIVLASRVPLPKVTYRAASGATVPLTFDGDGMTLLNLWAPWCRPCVAELTELVSAKNRLRAVGLRVIALNVEQLDDEAASSDAADRLLDRLKFPFTAATATTELVDCLEVVQRTVLDIKQPLPLPSSFLIDRDGRVVAIYRGPLKVDRLLRDAALLAIDNEKSRELAVPLRGRRLRPPARFDPLQIAMTFFEGGYLNAARRYLEQCLEIVEQKQPGAELMNPPQLNTMLGTMASDRGETALAAKHFAAAANWHFDRARSLHQAGNVAEALGEYRAALRLQPDLKSAMNNLAWILATDPNARIRNGDEALRLATRLCEATKHRRPTFLDTLAAAQAETGRYAAAVKTIDRAIELAKRAGRDDLLRQLQARRQKYQSGNPQRGEE